MLKYYLKKASKMSVNELLHKGKYLFKRMICEQKLRLHDRYASTYMSANVNVVPVIYKDLISCDVPIYAVDIAELNKNHYFDLLGSGWVCNSFGVQYAGCEGHCYNMQLHINIDEHGDWLKHIVTYKCLLDSQKVWKFVSPCYKPIDWQIDFKSGYRWTAKKWYMDMEYGHLLGVDIKVPWELARMQHLVQYVYGYMQSECGDKEKYVQEFKDEILDFIAQNPPRYGVNWHCTMDVGIRIANWLIAYDLFCSLGVQFDENFRKILADATYIHGVHILNNLEYSKKFTTNHYLSNIGGLIFVAVHLESNEETDAWLAFGLQELVSEMRREFHADGSNFEASTSYHCLSTEIMLYSSLLCINISEKRRNSLQNYKKEYITKTPYLRDYKEQEFDLNEKDIFPAWFWRKLGMALEFVDDISDAEGGIPQIGDADSGRFLKLSPVFHRLFGSDLKHQYMHLDEKQICDDKIYFDEDLLNYAHLIRAGHYLKYGCDADEFKLPEKEVVCKCGVIVDLYNIKSCAIKNSDIVELENKILKSMPVDYTKHSYRFESCKDLLEGLIVKKYEGMGIYIFSSLNMKLIVRCGEVGQNGNGGHSHNDQLSICLEIDGQKIIRDAGSYLYTSEPDIRNKFRSTAMHFTPQCDALEQNEWTDGVVGLFSIKSERTYAKVLSFGDNGMIMMHSGFGFPVYRIIKLDKYSILVTDYGRNLSECIRSDIWSNGYGKLCQYHCNETGR